jgi:hypothetical protein
MCSSHGPFLIGIPLALAPRARFGLRVPVFRVRGVCSHSAQALPRFCGGTASRVIGYPFVTAYANDDNDTTLCAACAEDARKGGGQPRAVTITAGTRECDYCFGVLE